MIYTLKFIFGVFQFTAYLMIDLPRLKLVKLILLFLILFRLNGPPDSSFWLIAALFVVFREWVIFALALNNLLNEPHFLLVLFHLLLMMQPLVFVRVFARLFGSWVFLKLFGTIWMRLQQKRVVFRRLRLNQLGLIFALVHAMFLHNQCLFKLLFIAVMGRKISRFLAVARFLWTWELTGFCDEAFGIAGMHNPPVHNLSFGVSFCTFFALKIKGPCITRALLSKGGPGTGSQLAIGRIHGVSPLATAALQLFQCSWRITLVTMSVRSVQHASRSR